jgi:hypothetical protein
MSAFSPAFHRIENDNRGDRVVADLNRQAHWRFWRGKNGRNVQR